jgi:AraC family transcriptional regulator
MTKHTRAPGGLSTWQMTRVLDYIERHLSDKIAVQELARLVGEGCDWFQRAFKSSTGIPPYRFIAGRRLALACALLKTTREPLSQVALYCGLYDQSHFSRTFRRNTGMNPAAWRRAHAVEPRPLPNRRDRCVHSCDPGCCHESSLSAY